MAAGIMLPAISRNKRSYLCADHTDERVFDKGVLG
jgi:hypothetical protein